MRAGAVVSIAMVTVVFAGAGAAAQKLTTQDLAGRLSGTWALNRDLSSGFRAQGRRGGALMFQRGRGGSGGGRDTTPSDPGDLTPEQRAERAAMQQLQQIAERITIKASAESVTFTDTRGERTFEINDKTFKIDVGGSLVNVKSKWDKDVLRQEFSNTQAKLVETWGLDGASHLVLTAKLESMTLMTPPEKAVFDRQ